MDMPIWIFQAATACLSYQYWCMTSLKYGICGTGCVWNYQRVSPWVIWLWSPNTCDGLSPLVLLVKLCSVEYHWTPLLVNHHWFRSWLGAVRQQAITSTDVDLIFATIWRHKFAMNHCVVTILPMLILVNHRSAMGFREIPLTTFKMTPKLRDIIQNHWWSQEHYKNIPH